MLTAAMRGSRTLGAQCGLPVVAKRPVAVWIQDAKELKYTPVHHIAVGGQKQASAASFPRKMATAHLLAARNSELAVSILKRMTTPEQKPFRFSLRRLLTIVVVIAVGVALYEAAFGPPSMSRLFGSAESLAIVREATRVEAYRLAPPNGVNRVHVDTSPLEYRTTAGPVIVKSELAEALQETLLSPQTYRWRVVKECGYPVYGVKLSFFRGSERVDVYLCLKCSVLAVVRDEQVVGIADFDYGERVFFDAVKKLIPQDAEIQAIRNQPAQALDSADRLIDTFNTGLLDTLSTTLALNSKIAQ